MDIKMYRRIASIALVIAIVLNSIPFNSRAVKAETKTYTSGEFQYTLDSDDNATIVAYSGAGGSVNIPVRLDGHVVTNIGDYTFNKCTALKAVEIPDTVISIGNGAFAYTSLTSLTLPKELKRVGYSVISGVKDITSITIPKTIETMQSKYVAGGEGAFAGSSIKTVEFEEGITKIPNNAFSKCTTLDSVTIPDSVTEIGEYAFNGCTALKAVEIPDTVISMGNGAFAYTSLTSLTLPRELKRVGYSVISGVKNITSITIPKTIETMQSKYVAGGEGAFAGSSIKTVEFEEGITKIPNNAFSKCTTLDSVTIPDSVTEIGEYAFNGCTALKAVEIPDTVISIGNSAFAYTSLTSLTLPKELKRVGYSVISGVKDITSITIPKTIETMQSKYVAGGEGAFAGSSIKTVEFEEGITKIPNNAFSKCTTLDSATIPDSVTEIGEYAFNGCTALKAVEIPDTVISIGNNAFAYTSLTSLTLPKELKSIGYSVISGVKDVTSITIPKTIETMQSKYVAGGEGAFAGSSIKTVEFEEGITKIPNNAFSKCTTLDSATIPDSVTEIGEYAFNGCTALKAVEIPDTVISIGNNAFAYTSLTNLTLPKELKSIGYSVISGVKDVTSIIIPKTIETMQSKYVAGGEGAFAGSSIKKVEFEKGITKIPNNAFSQCTTLEKIEIPTTITVIGDNAFNGCTSLKKVDLPSKVTTIGNSTFRNCSSLLNIKLPNSITNMGNNVFSGCKSLVVYCNYYTNNAISCINQNLSFAPSDEKFVDTENKILDRKKSYFYANMDSVSSSGYLPMTIHFDVKNKWKGELSNQKIVIYIPQYTELIEDSIKVNGDMLQTYTYAESKQQLIIPINADSGSISYSIKIKSKENVVSYAYLSANKEESNVIENIDVVNESFKGITLSAQDTVNEDKIKVSGIASASTDIDLYLDGEKQGRITSLKNGSYSGEITIENPIDCYTYNIEARCIDEYDADISASKNVSYKENAPELKSLTLEYNEHNIIKSCDMMNTNGTKPRIYYVPNTSFTFKAAFSNNDNIEKVYITSTRNNEKKLMEANYDAASGLYVASGYFDETNTSYVPGTIGVEYREKTKTVVASEHFDITPYQNIMKNEVESADVDYEVNTEEEVKATIDFSKSALGLDKAIIKAGVKYIDTTGFDSLEDIYDFCGMGETLIKYTVPGADGNKYILNMDFTDPDNINMLLYDALDAGSKLAGQVISLNLDMSQFGSEEYMKWDLANNVLGNSMKAVGFAYKAYGIYSDYYDLIDDIDKSDFIEDKYAAKQKALELRQDQMAFMALTMVMPMLVAGSTMAAPVLVFSVLIGAMTSLSGMIYDMRVANIKGQTFKLNFVVDPSGYVYDAETNDRIDGATVTAYWIPYDDSDDFWKNKPADTEYGTKWKSEEYEQANPLLTNVDGKYAWDVPEGWWRVKCEKEGYQTTWSDWMTVPPVQTDINIAMHKIGEEKPSNDGNNQTQQPEKKPSQSATPSARPELRSNPSVAKITKPKKAVIKSARNSSKRTIKLKLKKLVSDGYQIQISTNKKFTKGKKTYTTTKVSYSIKKLKKGKKYYIRVRGYNRKGTKKLYGKWSIVKKVKIKK